MALHNGRENGTCYNRVILDLGFGSRVYSLDSGFGFGVQAVEFGAWDVGSRFKVRFRRLRGYAGIQSCLWIARTEGLAKKVETTMLAGGGFPN